MTEAKSVHSSQHIARCLNYSTWLAAENTRNYLSRPLQSVRIYMLQRTDSETLIQQLH